MKKTSMLRSILREWGKNKILLSMKIMTVLLLVGTLHVSASVYSQSKTFSLKYKNVKVKDVFKVIEGQSNFRFFYNDELSDVNRSVDIEVEDTKIEEILGELLDNSEVSYKVLENNLIVVAPDEVLQQKKISGNVIDAITGEALIGVNVTVEGTTIGVITNIDGNFDIELPNVQSSLIFSYVGYVSQTVKPTSPNISIKLESDIKKLDEIVVVGYGTQRKVTVTGSVASISGKDVVKSNQTDMGNALAGKIPGIATYQSTGEPGSDKANLNIRGFGEPLVIVDGIERSFTQLDPNEIESISVLKDASAAVYGFKGANGVILVTTKKGSGEAKINYNMTYGIQKPGTHLNYADAYEYATLRNEALQNFGKTPLYTRSQLDSFKINPGTDWYSSVVKESAPQQQHNLNVSGSTEKVNYFFSIGYTNQKSILGSSENFDRFNFRSNISAKIKNNLTAEFQVGGRYQTTKQSAYMGGGSTDIFRALAISKPTEPVYANDNPKYYQNLANNRNPAAMVNSDYVGYKNNNWQGLQSQVSLRYDVPFVKGLSVKGLLAIDESIAYDKIFNKNWNAYSYNKVTQNYDAVEQQTAKLEEKYWLIMGITQQYSLNYDRTFGAHSFNGLLLAEPKYFMDKTLNASRLYTITTVDNMDAGNSDGKENSGKYKNETYMGYVGRFNYGYDNKYLIEYSFRQDGSFKNAPGSRWGFFPGVSLGWRMSNESFIKDNLSFIENLKLRASWGKMGDASSLKAYQYQSAWSYPATEKDIYGEWRTKGTFFQNGVFVSGTQISNLANPNITWYTVDTKNVGLDASLWKGLLTVEMDLFYRKRDGLFAQRNITVPTTFGAEMPQENLNSDESRGIEISLGSNFKIGEVSIGVKGMISYTKTMNLYNEGTSKNASEYLKWRNSLDNRNMNIQWGYVALGQFQDVKDILASPVQDKLGNSSILPGDIKYKDMNGDGIINELDQTPIGRGMDAFLGINPGINGGLTLNAEWKGIDCNIHFQGAGNYTYNPYVLQDQFIQGFGNVLDPKLDRWHKADYSNPESEWVAGKFPALRGEGGYDGNSWYSTFWAYNVYYIRLKSFDMGYNIPKSILKSVRFENMRIFVNVTNLLTFTNVEYVDPEATAWGGGLYYPQMRNYNVGLNITF